MPSYRGHGGLNLTPLQVKSKMLRIACKSDGRRVGKNLTYIIFCIRKRLNEMKQFVFPTFALDI